MSNLIDATLLENYKGILFGIHEML